MRLSNLLIVALALAFASTARAGLYYSGETMADLPSQWSGFLLDQRTLRNIAVPATAKTPDSPVRTRYLDAASKLEAASRMRALSADEEADLGALYIRLGDIQKAVATLRRAQTEHPNHFHIAANLGTAWQLQGDLNQAAAALRQAVKLAPGKCERYESFHLKMVQLRQREARDAKDVDDLFGVRFSAAGKYEVGHLSSDEFKKLPPDAAAIAQQLGLWLPADGRLLWLTAEIANALDDVQAAAGMLDGCVTQFGMGQAELRHHRQILRAAANERAKARAGDALRAAHELYPSKLKPKSRRPLVTHVDASTLPPIRVDGINVLPWSVLSETRIDRKYHPTFAKYLQELDGKQVELSGFLQPMSEESDLSTFMLIEYPVGCWYCEMPEVTGIVYVELPPGKTAHYTRTLIKVRGKLTLNATDPENFLYTMKSSTVRDAD